MAENCNPVCPAKAADAIANRIDWQLRLFDSAMSQEIEQRSERVVSVAQEQNVLLAVIPRVAVSETQKLLLAASRSARSRVEPRSKEFRSTCGVYRNLCHDCLESGKTNSREGLVVPQVVMHEDDEPDVLVDLLHADCQHVSNPAW
jgi:hypothetical protein